ncbi:hypothetical protein CesoFtcFv8_025434 [Champsocephalus esox]|uniref:Uncharacterized protein n=1 Tax=Champsocephalus esox TaxID=159716 RepID=A0AAN8B4R4_9TELE|nr:hypothetical protein CesoFtcFv8_025434 [Champsocephalus esox]
MAVNLVLILERGLAKTAFPPQRNKKNRDVKHAPFPELLASVYRRGITVVSGGAAGAVQAVIEPKGNKAGTVIGFNNMTQPQALGAIYFLHIIEEYFFYSPLVRDKFTSFSCSIYFYILF